MLIYIEFPSLLKTVCMIWLDVKQIVSRNKKKFKWLTNSSW
jgi:hypothetical protein